MVKRVLIVLIKGYQKFISPFLGDNCRFYPTCSAYAIEALRVHGVFKGSLLAAWRILRCNPFGRPGLDPVPPRGKSRHNPHTTLRRGVTRAADLDITCA